MLLSYALLLSALILHFFKKRHEIGSETVARSDGAYKSTNTGKFEVKFEARSQVELILA